MYPLIGSAILGALLMGRTKPVTKTQKMQLFGPRTGTVYQVDVLPGGEVIACHSPGSTAIALFQKTPEGYKFLKSLSGTREELLRMNSDFV